MASVAIFISWAVDNRDLFLVGEESIKIIRNLGLGVDGMADFGIFVL